MLEQSARLIYKEWFVHLRFPGYEKVSVVDGVPEGWTTKNLGELLTLKRGYDLPKSKRQKGPIAIVSSSGVTGFHTEAKAKGPGVITGRYGTLGEVYLVENDFWPLNTALYVKDFKGNMPHFVYHLLANLLNKTSSDKAAVPGVNRNDLHRLKVRDPPPFLKKQFLENVAPIHQQVTVLERQNEKLAEARDLLLPRLMSGQIRI